MALASSFSTGKASEYAGKKVCDWEQQYRELLRLKEEINTRLSRGTHFQNIKELMLMLAKDQGYQILRGEENQMIILEGFLGIWLKEKHRLPELGIETDIFYQIGSMDELEHKYQKIKYCGLRIENKVPDEYIEQAFAWLTDQRISGIVMGKIVIYKISGKQYIISRWKAEADRGSDECNPAFAVCQRNISQTGKISVGRSRLLTSGVAVAQSAGAATGDRKADSRDTGNYRGIITGDRKC